MTWWNLDRLNINICQYGDIMNYDKKDVKSVIMEKNLTIKDIKNVYKI